ncbi:MAG: 3-deoxy-manno-octulosonate cytidylyltransferase [Pseudomonadales bacterium]|nr:3-deoxy-manno-octulosonate cytidylyltransferase [Pseudomonadales bacterium]
MKTLILIPARFSSSRLPGKPLKDDTGYPLIQHVYESAKKSSLGADIVVATDDERIQSVVTGFGADCVMTRSDHESGSDRIAEAAKNLAKEYDVVVNVQGDEPELDPKDIDLVAEIQHELNPFMSTLACRFSEGTETGAGTPLDPACVKVVMGEKLKGYSIEAQRAVYFSRSIVPYPRHNQGMPVCNSEYFMHIGMYAYSPQSIVAFSELNKAYLEKQEQLEQLRAIENNLPIHVGLVEGAVPGIDTPDDYAAFVKRWGSKSL